MILTNEFGYEVNSEISQDDTESNKNIWIESVRIFG